MVANALEHKPPWEIDAVFTTCSQWRAPKVQHRQTGGLLFQFHVTAGKTQGATEATEEDLHGCRRRVPDMDPFCSAGSYLSTNREDSKYQHLSQCSSFFFAALLPADNMEVNLCHLALNLNF